MSDHHDCSYPEHLDLEAKVSELEATIADCKTVKDFYLGQLRESTERVAQMGKESLEHQTRMQEYRAENTRLREALASALAKEPGWNQKANEALATTRQAGHRGWVECPAKVTINGEKATQDRELDEVFDSSAEAIDAPYPKDSKRVNPDCSDYFCQHNKTARKYCPICSTSNGEKV